MCFALCLSSYPTAIAFRPNTGSPPCSTCACLARSSYRYACNNEAAPRRRHCHGRFRPGSATRHGHRSPTAAGYATATTEMSPPNPPRRAARPPGPRPCPPHYPSAARDHHASTCRPARCATARQCALWQKTLEKLEITVIRNDLKKRKRQ